MKKLLLMLLMAIVMYSTRASADATALCNAFTAGQVVSADVLNEAFCSIQPDISTTLIGQWSTQCWDGFSTSASSPGTGTLTITALDTISYTGVSCLAGTGSNGTAGGTIALRKLTALGNYSLFVEYHSTVTPAGVKYKVNNVLQLEKNKIVVTTSIESGVVTGVEVLTRINTVPLAPTSLAAATSGLVVTLTWTDASTNETSFQVVRKDSLLGAYAVVGTVTGDTTTYSETVVAGTYWYRVQAVNANGTSTGSNVVKVTVP